MSFEYILEEDSKINEVTKEMENGIVKTIKYSVLVAGDNIKATIVMSIFVMGVILINLTSVLAVNLITINVGVGLVAYVLSYYYNDIFVKYGVEGNR